MSQQIQITGGAKVRDLQDVIIGTSGVLSSVAFDVANGVPRLDSNGKILVSQLPNSIMEYKGTWNAATNTPTLANGTGNQGDVYLCNVAGTVDFGAGPISFIVGDSAVYSGSIWQRSGGATGSVTSVGLSTNGGAITIGSSPVTTSGTITANFNGTNLQYVNGAGNLTTFPTLITSIGLSMPSAFSVANSPLTANGTIAVTGAGYASQYIRGDGTLADFPSSGGGGSSVSYYLNGGTSQGTIGGTTYYEMSKTADTGTGVDFAKSGDGFIVAFLTDANDPAQLNIPAGNWNYEIYASMSANGGTPQMYAELYKYDGTTFTLISTSTNEILYDGTNLNLYTFGMTVPATTLTLTDRLAIKLYATNSGGKTTTVHTQDSHLCQVITTFSTGITALNGLTAQVQYFQTGTSGTDFNISSTTATHTFNIPDASATARGLITTGTQTIAGIKTFSSGINVDYIGVTGDIGMDGSFSLKQVAYGTLQSGYTNLSGQTNGLRVGLFGGYNALLNFSTSGSYTYTFPAASGTIALTSDIPSLAGYVTLATTQTITGAKTFSGAVTLTSSVTTNNLTFANSGFFLTLQPPTLSVNRTVTLPDATGTLALTSDLTPYALNSEVVKLTGNQTIAGLKTFSVYTTHEQGALIKHGINLLQAGYTGIGASTLGLVIGLAGGGLASLNFNNTTSYTYTFPDATGTIALVGGSGVGTVTSVAALTIGTSGTDLSSTVANSTTTPVITLNVPTASATNRGVLASADWTTFNNKQSALTNPVTGTGTTNYLPKFTGTSTIGNSVVNDNGTGIGIGIAAASPFILNTLSTDATTNSIIGIMQIGRASSGTAANGIGGNLQFTAQDTSGTQRTAAYITWKLAAASSASPQGYLAIGTRNASEALRIDDSGNLGLGVTPSAWWSNIKALQIGARTAIFDYASANSYFTNNIYIDGSAVDRYIATAAASMYAQYGGSHYWLTAPSGTAGAAITYNPAMTLTASGRLLINTPTESTYQLDVNGTGRFSGALMAQSTGANIISKNTTTSQANLIRYDNSSGTARAYLGYETAGSAFYIENAEGLIYNYVSGGLALTLNADKSATFSSSVTATGGVYAGDSKFFNSVQLTDSLGGTCQGFLWTDAANTLKIGTGTVSGANVKMTITSGGNVGIGTTSPAYKLDVNGTGRFSGKLTGANASFSANVSGDVAFDITNTNTTNGYGLRVQGGVGSTSYALNVVNAANTVDLFKIMGSGAATFSSSVTNTSGMLLNVGATGTNANMNYTTFTNGVYSALNSATPSEGVGMWSDNLGNGMIGALYNSTASSLNLVVRASSSVSGLIALKLSGTGAATFSSSVTVNSDLISLAYRGTTAYNYYDLNGAGAHRFRDNNGNNILVSILNSGNVGIGTSSPNYTGYGAGITVLSLATSTTDKFSAIELVGNRGIGGNQNGLIAFINNNVTATVTSRITGINGASNVLDGELTFETRTSAGSLTERMRITSGGQVSIGPSGTVYGTNLLNVNGGIYATSSVAAVVAADLDMMVFQNTGATYTKSCLVASMTATGGTGSYFFYGQQSTSTAAIKIFSNGNIQNTNNSYGAISDARLKENIKDATPKLDDLMKVKVRNYNLKGESNKQLGVISQELEAIFPNMIEESTNMGENMKIKGVKYSVFVPMLIKAVQEQQQQINELKQLLNK